MSLQNNFKIIGIFTLAIFLTVVLSACDMEVDNNTVEYSEYNIIVEIVDADAPIYDRGLEDVRVFIENFEGDNIRAEMTDEVGVYEGENIKLVPGEEFEIYLSKVGYENKLVTAVADEDPKELTFELEDRN